MPSPRILALASGAIGIVLTLAQYVAPAWPGFHVWQYAATLVLVSIVLLAYARSARREEGRRGARLAIAAVGAFVIAAGGIFSGLLGPDTRTIASAPGSVSPLPDVRAAAFFPLEDAGGIARSSAHVILRRRDAGPLDIGPGQRRYLGALAIETTPELAAYVEARDARGGHLTVTQPTSGAFLSAVLFFAQRVTIAGRSLPADSFATPAIRRAIKVFYFAKDDGKAAAALHGVSGPAVLLAVDDERGKLLPGGIGFAPSGRETMLAGMSIRATLGTYPALVISAVPYPPAIAVGLGLLVFGVIAAGLQPRKGDQTAESGVL